MGVCLCCRGALEYGSRTKQEGKEETSAKANAVRDMKFLSVHLFMNYLPQYHDI